MHEAGIIEEIINTAMSIADEHRLLSVTSLKIKIGSFRRVVPENMHFLFDAMTKGTLLEKSKLIIIQVPVKLLCQDCGHTFIPVDYIFSCPRCSSKILNFLEGRELILESIEGETREDQIQGEKNGN